MNGQLLVQITTLQNTRGPPPSPERPTAMEVASGEQSQSRRHCRATFPLHRGNSMTSQVCLIRAQRIDMIILRGRSRSSSVPKILTSLYKSESKKRGCYIMADSEPSSSTSNSTFSEGILEYEFPKKFMIPTFNCYSS